MEIQNEEVLNDNQPHFVNDPALEQEDDDLDAPGMADTDSLLAQTDDSTLDSDDDDLDVDDDDDTLDLDDDLDTDDDTDLDTDLDVDDDSDIEDVEAEEVEDDDL
jgi:hypothetical protein